MSQRVNIPADPGIPADPREAAGTQRYGRALCLFRHVQNPQAIYRVSKSANSVLARPHTLRPASNIGWKTAPNSGAEGGAEVKLRNAAARIHAGNLGVQLDGAIDENQDSSGWLGHFAARRMCRDP
jgi:hypothetical protein